MRSKDVQKQLKRNIYFSFLAANDFHDDTVVLTKTVGEQKDEDKPGTQENKQGAFKDKKAFNDGTIPSGNSMLRSN